MRPQLGRDVFITKSLSAGLKWAPLRHTDGQVFTPLQCLEVAASLSASETATSDHIVQGDPKEFKLPDLDSVRVKQEGIKTCSEKQRVKPSGQAGKYHHEVDR